MENRVALCPRCEHPHHYVQVRERCGVNDKGAWQVKCDNCRKDFTIDVTNPDQSYGPLLIIDRFDEGDSHPSLPSAKMVAIHNLSKSEYAPEFKLDSAPLYVCQASGENLEPLALASLKSEFAGITSAYSTAENYLASKSTFEIRHAVVRVRVTCPCDASHIATFFTPFVVGRGPRAIADYLLADVTGANLCDRLEGVMSKSDIMDLLSKLLIRWRLSSERIIVASPFVGHQWDKVDALRDRWDRLLKYLAPGQATLITRPATLTAFKKLGQGDITYDNLKKFGLENRIISANTKKQDFHAKFFIGVGPERCEVLSGSANIMVGPSMENIVFREMARARCEARYIGPMNVTMPKVEDRPQHFVEIRQNGDGNWTVGDVTEALPLYNPATVPTDAMTVAGQAS